MSKRHIPIAIRSHTEMKKDKKSRRFRQEADPRKRYGKRIMVLDTETTVDIPMNLLFGQAMIVEGSNQAHIDGMILDHYLFYGDNLTTDNMALLRQYASKQGAILISKQDFMDNVFLPEVWELGTVCVGFNLPFDLSHLARSVRTFQKGKHRDMLEIKLSGSKYKPTLLIKPIDSKKAFISLRFPTYPKSSSSRIPFREGRFIDLRTLVFALTNESHSLDSACKLYQVRHGKGEVDKHGEVTPEYIEYNRRDVEATLDLYCKAKEEFDRHSIPLEAGKAYSPATIGKKYQEAMNILPFYEKQPDFPKEIIGYAMAAYYGGRSECHYRNTPIKTFHTDITSMYPSVFTLQNLWSWVIADKLQVAEATKEVTEWLQNISLDGLFNKDSWLNVPGLVQIMPDNDLLPVRAEYGKVNGYQIGLNYLTCDRPMWYTLADIAACRSLTGKTPKILKAIRLIPGKPQEGLKSVNLRGQIPIDPVSNDFFKTIIELRKEVKKKVKQKGDEHDAMQLFLKILANSTSYGIYIEMNREEFEQDQQVDVYGLDHFSVTNRQVDINGRFYNPLIAVMITGAARLVLAMMEKTVSDLGGSFAFCDTDSMAIIDLVNNRPDEIGMQVVDKFRSLYPYDDDSKHKGASLLEAEDYNWQKLDWNKGTDKQNLNKAVYYPLYCFMVSAKRYVLYNLIPDKTGSNKIVIRKKSDHGLGHLTSPVRGQNKNDWVNDVWKWIISREHDIPYQEPEWFYYPAFAQLSISKPSIYNILNRETGQDYSQQVKPFNFMLVAYPVEDRLFESQLIDKYYCRLHKSVGLGICHNKSKCQYSMKCFANLHMIPIAPYDRPENWKTFKWLEKNTKDKIQVRLSNSKSDACKLETLEKQIGHLFDNRSEAEKQALFGHLITTVESELFDDNKDGIIVRSYFDFVKEYASHPELKYDDSTGNQCGRNSKGLLQRTHIVASSVKHIGKETNTLQDKEEEVIIPDEMNWDLSILNYQDDKQMDEFSSRIDLQQWIRLRGILRLEAKPRKQWAIELGINLDYFKQLLSGRRMPSPRLYEVIINLCKVRRIIIPEGSKPIPSVFAETMGVIYPLKEIAFTYGIPLEETKEIFSNSIFSLYGTDYFKMEGNIKNILSQRRKQIRQEQRETEINALKSIQVYGTCLNDDNPDLQGFDFETITQYQVSREVGRSYVTLNIRTKDGNIYKVLQKHNLLVFKYGLLPKPSKVSFGQAKKVSSKHGYRMVYGQWHRFHAESNISRVNG